MQNTPSSYIVQCQLAQKRGNPQVPASSGDAIKVIVEFPLPDNFTEIIRAMQGNSFNLYIGNKKYSCTLYQASPDTKPIGLIMPDSESSPPIVQVTLDVYDQVEIIVTLKNSKTLKLEVDK